MWRLIIDGLVMNLTSVIVFATWPGGGGILDDVAPIPRRAHGARMYHVNITSHGKSRHRHFGIVRVTLAVIAHRTRNVPTLNSAHNGQSN